MNRTPSRARRAETKAATLAGGLTLLGASAKGQGRGIRIGLVGCGGRGRTLLSQARIAGKQVGAGVQVAAVCDFFGDRAAALGKRCGVESNRCFEGADGYRKLLETDAQLVLLATPPVFRPAHVEACIAAGKHVYAEKPAAVDPTGARRFLAAARVAESKGLCLAAGTQRRHARRYRSVYAAISQNAIGRIVNGCVWWCGARGWVEPRRKGESNASYLVRNWINFAEMSGDHIVEQHVHNIDVANWYLGRPPKRAVGFGGRSRRGTGNQFDFFSVDYDYGDGCRIHSMSRQIDGCWNRVGEHFTGTRGSDHTAGRLALENKIQIPSFDEFGGSQVQMVIDLLAAILSGKPLNEGAALADSTLAAILGRLAAYSGAEVAWADVAAPDRASPLYDLQLKPTAEDFEAGEVTLPDEGVAPVPGAA